MAIFTGLAAAGSTVLGAFGFTAATTGAAIFYGALTYAALGYATNALLGPKPTPQGANRGYRVTASGTALDSQIIYGQARTGGVRVYRSLADGDNNVLYDVIALTAHESEEIGDVYVNEYKVLNYAATSGASSATSGLESGYVYECEDPDGNVSTPFRGGGTNRIRITKHTGEDNQAAESLLVSEVAEWTAAHQLRGVTYCTVRYSYNADVFPNGIPNLSFVVKGKKVYNPASGLTEWSDNPALCIADYLRSDYGLNEPETRVDYDLVQTAAVACDRIAANGEAWFTCNGSFTTAAQPHDILSDLLTSMGGLLWYAQGEWRMKAAVASASRKAFTEDDFRSGITLVTKHSRRDNFNIVRGKYQGAETQFQPTEYGQVDQKQVGGDILTLDQIPDGALIEINGVGTTDWNVVAGTTGVSYGGGSRLRVTPGGKALESGTTGNGQRVIGKYVVQDALEEVPIDFDLPFTDNEAEAQRIANIFLERNRQQMTFKCKFGISAFAVQVGDKVTLTRSRYGWTNKEFEVAWWSFGSESNGDLQVELTLREISDSVFDETEDGPTWNQADLDAIAS